VVKTTHGEKQSALKRGTRLGRLGAGLVGSYLGYQFQNLFLDAGERDDRRKSFRNRATRRVREELQALKGPVMKLGQMLSMQSHALPGEVTSELANLQMRAPAMHPSLARAQFKGSLGREPEDLFRSFELEPFAAASLGQVHRATAKSGARLAVKIQYPAIRSAIENDFKLLRSASIPARVSGYISDAILTEIEEGILRETDYLNEGRNIDFFRASLKPLAYVHVPEVYWSLTSERVLTMSLVPGDPLADFIAAKPSQQLRDLVGFRLLELFSFQIHSIHAIHADPHAGNYLIQRDGSVGLVDFGCVKKFSDDLIELMRLFRERRWLHADHSRRMMSIICGQQKLKNPSAARRILGGAVGIYEILFPRLTGSAATVVDFGDPQILNKMTRIWEDSMRSKIINPEFAFYTRAELGLYNLLHQLRARVDTSKIFGGPIFA
jgi:predicted unusual protein kinase regulating ubiquinone biosynthesis (AarF/ABC1/UbiB family)